jgi:hypothetical protein
MLSKKSPLNHDENPQSMRKPKRNRQEVGIPKGETQDLLPALDFTFRISARKLLNEFWVDNRL